MGWPENHKPKTSLLQKPQLRNITEMSQDDDDQFLCYSPLKRLLNSKTTLEWISSSHTWRPARNPHFAAGSHYQNLVFCTTGTQALCLFTWWWTAWETFHKYLWPGFPSSLSAAGLPSVPRSACIAHHSLHMLTCPISILCFLCRWCNLSSWQTEGGKVEIVTDFLGLQNHWGWWLQPWN